MILAYSAADIFVAPSIEDNLPNTLVVSISCGTLCVAFNTGGIPDIVEHKVNGYLSKHKDSQDLANGIIWCLENKNRMIQLSLAARNKALHEFSHLTQANRYFELFSEF